MTPLRSQPLFTIQLSLHPTLDLGGTPQGHRRIVPVSGGSFEGARLRGVVLPHTGSDWLLQRTDGSFQQDVRLMLQTDDGALISMSYRGVRHASEEIAARMSRGEHVDRSQYYLRTAAFFETSSAPYAWLNLIVAVGVGERTRDGASYDVFEVL